MNNDNLAKRTQQYVQVRDTIKEIEAKHKEELAPYKDILNQLEGTISAFLDANGLDSLKTEHGTCYKSTRYTASLADAEAFMAYVIKTERYELLDRKANVTAVRAFVQDEKNLPPGVNLTSVQTLGVRRKGSE